MRRRSRGSNGIMKSIRPGCKKEAACKMDGWTIVLATGGMLDGVRNPGTWRSVSNGHPGEQTRLEKGILVHETTGRRSMGTGTCIDNGKEKIGPFARFIATRYRYLEKRPVRSNGNRPEKMTRHRETTTSREMFVNLANGRFHSRDGNRERQDDTKKPGSNAFARFFWIDPMTGLAFRAGRARDRAGKTRRA